MFGQVVGFLSQPAQVHDLLDGLIRRCSCDDRGRAAVSGGEVGLAERVDEIHDDVDALEGSMDAGGVGHVRGHPADVGATARCAPGGRPRSPRARVRGAGGVPIRPCQTHRRRRSSWCCPVDEAVEVASADSCVDACLDLVVQLACPRRRPGPRREGGVVAGDSRPQLDTVGAAMHRERDRSGGAACEQAAGDRIGRRDRVRGRSQLRRSETQERWSAACEAKFRTATAAARSHKPAGQTFNLAPVRGSQDHRAFDSALDDRSGGHQSLGRFDRTIASPSVRRRPPAPLVQPATDHRHTHTSAARAYTSA